MTDYTYWQNALNGKFGPVHEGDAQPGFYRKRTRREGPFVPVAIWHDGEKMVAVVGGKPADPSAIWTFVCQHPITEAEFRKVEAGGQWSDMDEGIAEHADRRNSDAADPAEALKDQIDGALERLADYATIATDEQVAKAQSLRARLNELSREADKNRKDEKEPHLEASRAVDAKWQPLVKSAKSGADQVAKAMSAYETEKLRAQREAQRKAEEEARKREEAERAAKDAGEPVPATPEPPQPEDPAPQVETTIRGGYGRAAAVKTVKVATVTDQDAAYAYGPVHDHPELKSLIAKLAQRAVDAGHDVPGVTVEEQVKVA